MTDVNLKFDAPLITTHPVNLVFGGQLVEVSESKLRLQSTIPSPKLSAGLGRVRVLAMSATLPVPKMTSMVKYDNAVYRGPGGRSSSGWTPSDASSVGISEVMSHPLRNDAPLSIEWSVSEQKSSVTQIILCDAQRTQRGDKSGWSDAIASKTSSSTVFSEMLRSTRLYVRELTTDGVGRRSISNSSYGDLYRFPRTSSSTTWSETSHVTIDRESLSGVANPLPGVTQAYWQSGRKPPPGKSVAPPITPPGDGCYTPPVGSKVDLLFSELFSTSTDLLFKCENYVAPPDAAIIIPIWRSYIVMNDVHLKRVEGNHDLNATSLSLNIDMDSWTWGFSASLPASSLSLVKPGMSGDKVLLVASINGNDYLLLAEGIQKNRSFGKSSITVTGRGQSAALADPYSQILSFSNTIDRTAQQLMNDALTINGVPLGWAVDWRIDDWLVPAGAWNHRGSYMSAVTAIAAAAGAFVQPDPVNKILRIRPRYPVKPWEWNAATPDLQLPSAVVVNESIAWVDKPAYNAVYVSGATTGGVLGHVKRTGSAGDLVAPMVTDALITDAIAARQRGTYILADTGKMAQYSLSLPVLPETGIIIPGTMVRYVDDGPIIGIIKGVSANASTTNLRQTIEVQTHG